MHRLTLSGLSTLSRIDGKSDIELAGNWMLVSFRHEEQIVERSPGKAAAGDSDLFRHIVESVTDFAVFAVDASGSVVAWNVGAERLTGYCEPEILGQTGDLIFTGTPVGVGSVKPGDRIEAFLENESLLTFDIK